MTPRQLEIIQHALGCDAHGRSTSRVPLPPEEGPYYRNRFVTGPGSTDWEDCVELCKRRLMKDHGISGLTGGDHCFCVTNVGKQAMLDESPPPPKVSRGRQRYLDFLRADCGMTFIEYLKARDYYAKHKDEYAYRS